MSNYNVTTTQTGSASEIPAESSAADLQQKIQDAYAKLQAAAQQMGTTVAKQVAEIAKAYTANAEELKNPSQPHDEIVQLEAMFKVLQEPIQEDDADAAQKKADKESAIREFDKALEKYAEKSVTLQTMEEDSTKSANDKTENKHLQLAERAEEMRNALATKRTTQNSSQIANQVLTQTNREEAAKKKQVEFAKLINARQAPTADSLPQTAKKSPTEGLPKDAQASDKKPVKTTAGQQSAAGEEVGDSVELAEAFGENFEKPVDGESSKVAAKDAENDLETVAAKDNAADAENNPEKAKQAVQVALATGVLQPPVTAQSLDPKRDVTAVMREVSSECNGLLGECSEMQNSAMIFAMQGAVRNARVKGLGTLIQGDTRNGEPEAALTELQRVKKSAGLAANGVAGQGTTTPAAILGQDGKVEPSKSREQLAATVGQTAALNSPNVGPLSCYARSVSSWNLKDSEGTVGAEARGRSDVLA